MDFLPYFVVWLLLAAIPLSSIFLARRSPSLPILSIAFILIALVVWFIARPSTTVSLTLASWPNGTSSLGWVWYVDETGWRLTGIVLWLALGLLLYLAAAAPATVSNQPAVVGLLSAVLLPTLWSATPATLLTSWTLFAAVCWVVGQTAKRMLNWQPIAWSLLPLLLYSLAVALAASPTAAGFGLLTSTWSGTAISLTLWAAALQMVLSYSAPPTPGENTLAATVLLRLLPPLIGVVLLARLVAAVAIPFSAGLLATALGLFAILAGVWLAWVGTSASKTISARPAIGLSLALAGVAFLSGIWAGPDSLIAATRVFVLASSTLFLIAGERRSRGAEEQGSGGGRTSVRDTAGESLNLSVSQSPVSTLHSPLATPHSSARLFRPHLLALAVAFLAIAGLPPTAGFASLAPLYETWMAGIHTLLVVAIVLLLIPLLAITYRFAQRIVRRPPLTDDHMTQRPSGSRFWLVELAPLLLIIGVLLPGGLPLDAASLGTWLALFAAALGGLLLPHFLRQMSSIRIALRAALAFRPLPDRLPATLRGLVTPLTNAFADAYAILESDTGLLWLLALLLLFWWIS